MFNSLLKAPQAFQCYAQVVVSLGEIGFAGDGSPKMPDRILVSLLQRVHNALVLNPEFSPFGVVPLSEKGMRGEGETGVETPLKEKEADGIEAEDILERRHCNTTMTNGVEVLSWS